MQFVDNRDYKPHTEYQQGDVVVTNDNLILWLVYDEFDERYLLIEIKLSFLFDSAETVQQLIEHINEFHGGVREWICGDRLELAAFDNVT